ncbi:MAG: ATP-binding protein [Ornithinibacter sp.]
MVRARALRAGHALLAAACVTGFLMSAVAVAADGWSAGPSLAAQVMLTLVGVLLMADRAMARISTQVLLAAFFVGVTNLENSLTAGLSGYWLQVGWTFGWCLVPLLASVLLTYPGTRDEAVSGQWLVALLWVWALVPRLASSLLWQPVNEGANTEDWLTLYPATDFTVHINRGANAMLAVLMGWFCVLQARRWHRARGPARTAVRVVAASGVLLAVGLLLREAAPQLVAAGWMSPATSAVLAWVHAVLAAAAPAALLVLALRGAARQSLVVEHLLAASGDAPAVQDVLRSELDDPTLALRFAIDGQWFEADGTPVVGAEPRGRVVRTLLIDGSTPTAQLTADASVELDPSRLRVTVSATSLLLENTRLAVEREAHLVEIRESRNRIVEAGVAQRRQLERDLHDGAQQRLLAVLATLSRATLAEGGDAMKPVVEQARDELSTALEELRNLAKGIHPATLSQGGLGAGLTALTRPNGRVVLSLDQSLCDGLRLPAAVETTAYFVVAEAVANTLKHACDAHVDVAAVADRHRLLLSVTDDGPGGASTRNGTGLLGLQDRVRGLGGTMQLHSPPGRGTRLTVRLPLGEQAA